MNAQQVPKSVVVSRVMSAERAAVFEVLANPQRHAEIDGSGTLREAAGDVGRLGLGSRFGMRMRILGLPYKMTNTVIEFEDGARIAWRHVGRHIWRYELADADGGTRVTESWEYGPSVWPDWILKRLGWIEGHKVDMERTLDRLEKATTS